MSDSLEYSASFRVAIDAFIQARLQTKLDKSPMGDVKRLEVVTQHRRDIWLHDAARRVKHIQVVTHSLKPIHPEARGTNLYVEPAKLPALAEMGSHALGDRFSIDVVGNASSLDVFKFLKIRCDGRTLLSALEAGDADATAALRGNPVEAESLREAFLGVMRARDQGAASHTTAKQIYWLVGCDASNDAQYHLLAPLYPTSLAHAIHADIQEVRFGETNKLARQARRDGTAFDGVYREYQGIAVQKLGGTQPQNVSQLNSERRGVNYLLSSLPPTWEAGPKGLPVHAKSVFDRAFGARRSVRQTLHALRALLHSNPPSTKTTRDRVLSLRMQMVDELLIYAGELLQVPAGWTRQARFADLSTDEQLWLDPLRADLPDETAFADRWLKFEWPERVAERFATWLNAELREAVPDVGYIEASVWKGDVLDGLRSWGGQFHVTRSVPASSDAADAMEGA
ncbi:type I-F CRISPR-associated protein Csy1 [Burkholderia sp. 3C]